MLFHEIYSTYFQTVAKILTEAVDHPLTSGEIDSIVREYAFDESTLNIPEPESQQPCKKGVLQLR